MTERAAFTPRMFAVWLAAALLALVVALAFLLGREGNETIGPSTYSRSAIGHAGIYLVLRRHGVGVARNRDDTPNGFGRTGLLVIAEPDFGIGADLLVRRLLAARTILLVLPKWQGVPDVSHAGWIRLAFPLFAVRPQTTLDLVVTRSKVVRSDTIGSWTHNELGPRPAPGAPFQLISSPGLRPVVAGDGGILVGEMMWNGRRVWVLSDPDVIDNHGLAAGNAAFALALFDALRRGGSVVFDETIHHFATRPATPLGLLRQKPFAAIGLQALVAVALLLWAGVVRFGAPQPASEPLKAGKRELVRNVAHLFRVAGYQHVLVRRYVEETLRDVAYRLHAPADMTAEERLSWLQGAGASRQVSIDCAEVLARAGSPLRARRTSPAEQVRLAGEIWRWKREMLDGTGGDASHRGSRPRGDPQGRRRPG